MNPHQDNNGREDIRLDGAGAKVIARAWRSRCRSYGFQKSEKERAGGWRASVSRDADPSRAQALLRRRERAPAEVSTGAREPGRGGLREENELPGESTGTQHNFRKVQTSIIHRECSHRHWGRREGPCRGAPLTLMGRIYSPPPHFLCVVPETQPDSLSLRNPPVSPALISPDHRSPWQHRFILTSWFTLPQSPG